MTGSGREDLERFCSQAYPELVAALTHQFGDRWLAEELAQEALVRACGRWDRVAGLASPVGWTFRVGVNLGRSRLRRRAAESRARARRGPDELTHEDPELADRLTVAAALADLTEREREVVVLRYFLGLSAVDAAQVLDSSAGAVRVATHRAVSRLRASLTEVDLEEVPDVS